MMDSGSRSGSIINTGRIQNLDPDQSFIQDVSRIRIYNFNLANFYILINLPEKVDCKRLAQVKLDPFKNHQLHPDNVLLTVRFVSDVHKVLNLKQRNSKGVQQNIIKKIFEAYPLTFISAKKNGALPREMRY